MNRVLISKRAALDVITMQRRPDCYHHHKKMLLRIITKRNLIHHSAAVAIIPVGAIDPLQQQQETLKERRPLSSIGLHCKHQCVTSLITTSRTTNEGTLFCVAHTNGARSFHTATSPSGTDAQVLLSTRWGNFMSQEDARRQVARLSAEERGHLEKAIEDIKKRSEEMESEPPTWSQLKLLCYQNALPFIGFGFLDNVIMISVGEYIDTTIGVTLGISTMAAAGIGNMISDLAGLGLADQVEALCRRLGIPNPNLSSAQLRHRSSRWMGLIGRCVGIIIGCTIGMAPLLWFDDPHKQDSDHESCSSQEKH